MTPQAMKRIVVGMSLVGVIILAGFVVVLVEIVSRLGRIGRDPLAGQAEIAIGTQEVPVDLVPVESRVYLRTAGPEGERLYLLDGPTGRVLKRILPPEPRVAVTP